jgi:hypothetical protein
MKSVLQVPADWRAPWGPAIRTVKHNPDFVKHYAEYCVRQQKEYTEPEEIRYEPLLFMNGITLRTGFPTFLGHAETSIPLAQLVHLIEYGTSGLILDDGSSSPHLVAEGISRTFLVFTPNLRKTEGRPRSSPRLSTK